VSQAIPHANVNERGRRFVQVRGVEDPVVSGTIHELPLHDGGRWFDPGAGVQAGADGDGEQLVQAVLGEGMAREMGHDFGKPTMAVGDVFELGPRRWVVVGVMKSAGKTFDSEVWAKRKLVGEMLRKDTRSTAVIRVRDDLDPAEVAREMTAAFKSPAIQARTEVDYFESLNSTNATFLYAIVFVTVIMAVGGVFGIMNTMFAAIAQRTREIGVLRILGFARWQILVSFFLEALLLALIGGLLGCALGSLCNGLSATSQMSSGQGGGKSVMLKLVVDSRILASGLAFSLLMGCIGGLLPALSAIRLKALDSLR
jgi:ABC-type antimicrobial peptide transport system permease subunit